MKRNPSLYSAVAADRAVDWDHPLNRGRVVWWVTPPGVPAAGGRLVDLCGRYHGTVTSARQSRPPTPRGDTGLAFNGTTEYATTPFRVQDAVTTGITVAWWQRPTVAHNTGTIRGIWGQIQAPNTAPEFSAQVYFDNNWYIGYAVAGAAHRIQFAATASNWTLNTWSRYVFTAVSGGVSRLYQDGALLASNGGTTTFQSPALAFDFGQFNGAYFSGSIADFSIFRRAWTAADIVADFDLSRRGYRMANSPLRWITGRTYFAPLSATPSVFSPAFGPGWGFAA